MAPFMPSGPSVSTLSLPQRFQQFAAFQTHGRHSQGDAITTEAATKCQSDTRATAGWFNNFFACFQDAFFLRPKSDWRQCGI